MIGPPKIDGFTQNTDQSYQWIFGFLVLRHCASFALMKARQHSKANYIYIYIYTTFICICILLCWSNPHFPQPTFTRKRPSASPVARARRWGQFSDDIRGGINWSTPSLFPEFSWLILMIPRGFHISAQPRAGLIPNPKVWTSMKTIEKQGIKTGSAQNFQACFEALIGLYL